MQLGKGLIYINVNAEQDYLYNKNLSCAKCNISYQTLEPRFFSFNSPQGACISCSGLGVEMKIDADLLVPNQKQSLLTGCLLPIGEQPKSNWIGQIVASLLKEYNKPATKINNTPKIKRPNPNSVKPIEKYLVSLNIDIT